MSIKRRTLNGYFVASVAGGSAIGFVAGRYSNISATEIAAPALQKLRDAAISASGVHLIGSRINDFEPFNLLGTEQELLSLLGLPAAQLIRTEEFQNALSLSVQRDYLSNNLLNVEGYLLSHTEALFVRYALEKQGLVGVAYEAPAPVVTDGYIASDVKFGPNFTVVGQIFNEQPDGHGGIWVQAKNTPAGTVIMVNDRPIKTRRKPEALTGAIYGEELRSLIAKPAKHRIALFVPDTGIRQDLGEFEVRPRPPPAVTESGTASSVFCEIHEWSVKSENGGEKIVVRTLCGPRSSALYIGELALTTKVFQHTVEAILDRSVLSLEQYPLRLVDVHSGEAIFLGNFRP